MTNYNGKYCARCGLELQLAEAEWSYPTAPTGSKGEICGKCVASLPDEEEGYWN